MNLLRRPLVVLGAVLITAGLVGTIITLADGDEAEPRLTAPSTATSSPATLEGESTLERLEELVEDRPKDAAMLAALGQAYVQEARITGDPTYYPQAEERLQQSLEVKADGNLAALVGQSSLAAARHDFVAALDWAEQAAAVAPEDANTQGVLGDALLELGRYDEAFDAFQRMVDLRPAFAAYARVSYAQELQGDIDGAAATMEAALDSATGPADAAYAQHYLGELEWNRGQPDRAVDLYRKALRSDDTFLPAKAALGRAAFHDGRVGEAVELYEEVIDRFPLPQYVAELADVYVASGQHELAEEQFGLVEVQRRLFEANGVDVDVDTAVFNADHGIDLADSLTSVEAAWADRKSVFVADALAWLLHAAGRDAEALVYADEALRLGTRSALFHYHRSVIQSELGNEAAARADLEEAVAINPNFSILHSDEAVEAVSSG